MSFINYYDILEIDQYCDLTEIKAAYRRQAFKWHPDKNSSPNATKRMQEIIEAYLVLKDPKTRKDYNTKFNFQDKTRDNNANYDFQDQEFEVEINSIRKKAQKMSEFSLKELFPIINQGLSPMIRIILFAFLFYLLTKIFLYLLL